MENQKLHGIEQTFSRRQREIYKYFLAGKSQTAIASELNISRSTVQNEWREIKNNIKFAVNSREGNPEHLNCLITISRNGQISSLKDEVLLAVSKKLDAERFNI